MPDGRRKEWTLAPDLSGEFAKVDADIAEVRLAASTAKTAADAAKRTADSASSSASQANTKATKATDSATAAYERALAEMHTHLLCEHTDYGQPTSLANKFKGDTQLLRFPKMDTSKCTNFGGCCMGCTNLEEIPEDIDFSAATTVGSAFINTYKLKRFPGGDMSKLTSIDYLLMAQSVTKNDALTYCGDINTSNVTSAQGVFYGRTNLERFPSTLNLSKCTRAVMLFCTCYKLGNDNIPAITPPTQPCGAAKMFQACKELTGLPLDGDFSWSSGNWETFCQCTGLVNIGDLDISSSTEYARIFSGCSNLEIVGNVILYSKTEPYQVDSDGWLHSIQDSGNYAGVDGIRHYPPAKLRQITFRNLGNVINSSGATGSVTINIYYPAWGSGDEAARQSLVDSLLTYSIDRTAKGWGVCRLGLPSAVIARLTDEEKAAITAKGYSLVTYS